MTYVIIILARFKPLGFAALYCHCLLAELWCFYIVMVSTLFFVPSLTMTKNKLYETIRLKLSIDTAEKSNSVLQVFYLRILAEIYSPLRWYLFCLPQLARNGLKNQRTDVRYIITSLFSAAGDAKEQCVAILPVYWTTFLLRRRQTLFDCRLGAVLTFFKNVGFLFGMQLSGYCIGF